VPERDVDALTDRLIHVCDHPESWAEMGEKARAKIDAEFDTESINNTLEEISISLAGLNNGIYSRILRDMLTLPFRFERERNISK
jgi:hypothetical protein